MFRGSFWGYGTDISTTPNSVDKIREFYLPKHAKAQHQILSIKFVNFIYPNMALRICGLHLRLSTFNPIRGFIVWLRNISYNVD